MNVLICFISLLTTATFAFTQEAEWGDWEEDREQRLRWHGFVEGAWGSRWDRDPNLDGKRTLGDTRLRIETDWTGERFAVSFKGDLLYDEVAGEFDALVRDLSLAVSPAETLDLKLGRQVLTWGTGDLLFLNDLFPKDWVSFFAGREDEYLKAPADAIRLTFYNSVANIDFVWSPEFEPDNYLTGERFSFFSPQTGKRIAPDPPLHAHEPKHAVHNGELALRVFKNVDSIEYALYGYRGYFKQPSAVTDDFTPTFAPMSAVGASLRRPLGAGLLNAEVAYYHSRDDEHGEDGQTANSQVRLLTGYEREVVKNFTLGVQYYLEWTQDHDALLANSPQPAFEPDKYRHLLTSRLTYRAYRDKLTLSLFTFLSPSDEDYYLRPQMTYRYSDQWLFTWGASLFGGEAEHTFFGQFEDNSNTYLKVRFNY